MSRVGDHVRRACAALGWGYRSRPVAHSGPGASAFSGGPRLARFEPLESRLLLSITPLDWTPQGPFFLEDGQVEGMASHPVFSMAC